MFKTIVVGCDGSARDADAIALARQLGDPEDRILLAAVCPAVHAYAGVAADYGYDAFLQEDAGAALDRAAAALPAGIEFERHTLRGDSPAAALDAYAAEAQADLLVLGGTHHGRLARLLGRTTAQRALHEVPCAVAVAAPRQAGRAGALALIAVAYDGSPDALAATQTAYAIARESGATVRLVQAVEPIVYPGGYAPIPDAFVSDADRETETLALLDAAAAAAPDGVTVETQVASGHAASTVLALSEDADLLVAGSRHRAPLHRLFVGSVSTALVSRCEVPVLVCARSAEA
jgi:nucleotide-binding universal stress UspA family protein